MDNNALPKFRRFKRNAASPKAAYVDTTLHYVEAHVADATKRGVDYAVAVDNALALCYGMPPVTRFNYGKPFLLSRKDCETLGLSGNHSKLAMTFGSTIDCNAQPFRIYAVIDVEYDDQQIFDFASIAVGTKTLKVSRVGDAIKSLVVHSDFKFTPAFVGKLAHDNVELIVENDDDVIGGFDLFFSMTPARQLGFNDLIHYRKYIGDALVELMGYPNES